MKPLVRNLVLLAVSAALVACGSGDGAEPAAAPSPTTSSVADPDELLSRAPDLAAANSRADLNVLVVAQQWSWTFSYTKGGSTVDEVVWEGGPDQDVPTLWLVAGRSVNFTFYSPDVIHAFWPADLLFKADVVPERAATTYATLTPTEPGRFTGRCAELCGQGHSDMLFEVKVVDQAEFDQHLSELARSGQTGVNAPTGYAEEIAAG